MADPRLEQDTSNIVALSIYIVQGLLMFGFNAVLFLSIVVRVVKAKQALLIRFRLALSSNEPTTAWSRFLRSVVLLGKCFQKLFEEFFGDTLFLQLSNVLSETGYILAGIMRMMIITNGLSSAPASMQECTLKSYNLIW